MLLFLRSLLSLYPSAYRDEYGEEMMTVLAAVQSDITTKGPMTRAVACTRETAGLLRGALEEHVRSFLFPQRCSPYLQRRFSMRSEFRFPKATVTLMTIVLVAVIMTIVKATAIEESVPSANPAVGPIHPAHFTIVSTLLVIMAAVCVAGALVWAVLFALNRSGIQRLSELNPSADHRAKSGLFG
jgi:hypothetical protein